MTGITTAVRGPSAVRPNVAVGDAASNKRNSSLLGALVLLAAVQLMVVLDTTIVNVALPSIQKGLGFSISGIAWVVNGYALTFGALLLLGGAAAICSADATSSSARWRCLRSRPCSVASPQAPPCWSQAAFSRAPPPRSRRPRRYR